MAPRAQNSVSRPWQPMVNVRSQSKHPDSGSTGRCCRPSAWTFSGYRAMEGPAFRPESDRAEAVSKEASDGQVVRFKQ